MAGLPNIYDSCQKSKEINQNATINNNSNTNSKSSNSTSNSTSNLQQRQQLGNCNCSNTRHRQKRQSDVCLRRLVAACLAASLPSRQRDRQPLVSKWTTKRLQHFWARKMCCHCQQCCCCCCCGCRCCSKLAGPSVCQVLWPHAAVAVAGA